MVKWAITCIYLHFCEECGYAKLPCLIFFNVPSLHWVTCSLKTLVIFCLYCIEINYTIVASPLDCIPLWNLTLSAMMRGFFFSFDIHFVKILVCCDILYPFHLGFKAH